MCWAWGQGREEKNSHSVDDVRLRGRDAVAPRVALEHLRDLVGGHEGRARVDAQAVFLCVFLGGGRGRQQGVERGERATPTALKAPVLLLLLTHLCSMMLRPLRPRMTTAMSRELTMVTGGARERQIKPCCRGGAGGPSSPVG